MEYAMAHMWKPEENLLEFVLYTILVLGIKLRASALAASVLTH